MPARVGVGSPQALTDEVWLTPLSSEPEAQRAYERHAGRDERVGLHAVRVRLENHSPASADAAAWWASVVTAAGRWVDGDRLFEVGTLRAGEVIEGWIVFCLGSVDAVPTTLRVESADTVRNWSIVTD
jgi:hypothetical protein